MAKTSIIIDHLDGLSTEQKAKVGSKDQVEIRLRETDIETGVAKTTIIEFYNTMEEANSRKTAWDN
tara:strand:+ start:574 stop:771 length:198 start_codon:yes stop_codon:yes gene_type:complete